MPRFRWTEPTPIEIPSRGTVLAEGDEIDFDKDPHIGGLVNVDPDPPAKTAAAAKRKGAPA